MPERIAVIEELRLTGVQARRRFSRLAGLAACGHTRTIVFRNEWPMAAVISFRDLQKLKTCEREAGGPATRSQLDSVFDLLERL